MFLTNQVLAQHDLFRYGEGTNTCKADVFLSTNKLDVKADAVLSDLRCARAKVSQGSYPNHLRPLLIFLTYILAVFNVGDLVFEVLVCADTTRYSGVSHKEVPLSHASYGLVHQGRHSLPSGTTSLYTMTRSDCTSLEPLDAG